MPKTKAGPIATPVDMVATPPSKKKGGSGSYDGEPGYPGRTSSPNAVPEKTREKK